MEREHNSRAWLAWHIEVLHRAKRLPRLDRLTIKSKGKRGVQSWQQQAHVMAAWSARVDRAIATREMMMRN